MEVSGITVSPNYIFQLPETDDEGSAPAALRDGVYKVVAIAQEDMGEVLFLRAEKAEHVHYLRA